MYLHLCKGISKIYYNGLPMPYSLLRSLLFQLSPEVSHELSLEWMSAAHRLKILKPFIPKIESSPVEVMGITFPNPVGLAAGLDKNADHIDALGALGFGFLELGTVTPKPQPGNPKPRLFRLKDQQAIINRMGFNNKGIDHLVDQVKKTRFQGPIGINIGKNLNTPVEDAISDYLTGLREAYAHASYISVNVSSPNTPGLRSLQHGDALNELLDAIKEEQQSLSEQYGRYVPIAVKIAPDMDEEEIAQMASALKSRQFDGVIAGNTTLARDRVKGASFADEAGGLSGAPLTEKSTHVIRLLKSELSDSIPIIGVGGIMSGEMALDKIRAGASLVQLYTGFIYEGPKLIRDSVEAIRFGG
ncbi:MAG: dihydroorotate dehydrogenase [Oleiphilaceae bacterium]|jgi:dihydroorotate dehydrogenase